MNGLQCSSRMSARTSPTYLARSLSSPRVETRAASATMRSLPMWSMSSTPMSDLHSIVCPFITVWSRSPGSNFCAVPMIVAVGAVQTAPDVSPHRLGGARSVDPVAEVLVGPRVIDGLGLHSHFCERVVDPCVPAVVDRILGEASPHATASPLPSGLRLVGSEELGHGCGGVAELVLDPLQPGVDPAPLRQPAVHEHGENHESVVDAVFLDLDPSLIGDRVVVPVGLAAKDLVDAHAFVLCQLFPPEISGEAHSGDRTELHAFVDEHLSLQRDPAGVVLADLQLTLQEVDITVVELLRRVGEVVSRGHGAAGQLAPPAEDESAADGDQPEADRATDEQQCHHEFHGPPLSVRCGLVPPA